VSAVASLSPFLSALSLHWGYTSFRPGQEEIAASLPLAVMPASSCPLAAANPSATSFPLRSPKTAQQSLSPRSLRSCKIKSHKLDEMGIPAAVLNSSQSSSQRDAVRRDALSGKFRLLYLSPESIAQEGTLRWLKSLALSFFVIDEAHCISEWGHDFRPEYRLLSRLRREFPALPIAAFTARPRSTSGTTSSASSVSATHSNSSPASTAPTCNTASASARLRNKKRFFWTHSVRSKPAAPSYIHRPFAASKTWSNF